MKKTGAVLLAAGAPPASGQFKPLQPYGGSTTARTMVALTRQMGLEPVVVVIGYRGEELRAHLFSEGVRFLKTERPQSAQMLDSVKLGLKAAADECQRTLVLPMDMPAIQPETYRQLLRVDAPMVRVTWRGKPKHPVLLSAAAARRVCAYRGEGGLRGAMESLKLPITELEVEDRGVCRDGALPEEQVPSAHALRQADRDVWPQVRLRLCAGEPFFGPGTAELLEGIDQWGSLQEACARMGLSYSKGSKMVAALERQLGFPVTRRRAGGAGGGGSSLTEAGRRLLRRYQRMDAEVERFARDSYRKHFLTDCKGAWD